MHYVIGFWGRDNDMSGATIDQGYQRNEKLSELVLFYKKHTHKKKQKQQQQQKPFMTLRRFSKKACTVMTA